MAHAKTCFSLAADTVKKPPEHITAPDGKRQSPGV